MPLWRNEPRVFDVDGNATGPIGIAGDLTVTGVIHTPVQTWVLGTHLGQPGILPGAVRGGGNPGEFVQATANQDWVWDLIIPAGATLQTVAVVGEVAVATAFVGSAFSYDPTTGVVGGISAGISSGIGPGIYNVDIPITPVLVVAPMLYSVRWRSMVTGNRARACIYTTRVV